MQDRPAPVGIVAVVDDDLAPAAAMRHHSHPLAVGSGVLVADADARESNLADLSHAYLRFVLSRPKASWLIAQKDVCTDASCKQRQ